MHGPSLPAALVLMERNILVEAPANEHAPYERVSRLPLLPACYYCKLLLYLLQPD